MSQDRELAKTKARNLTAMQATRQRPGMSPQSSTSACGQYAEQQSLRCRLAVGLLAAVDEVDSATSMAGTGVAATAACQCIAPTQTAQTAAWHYMTVA